MKGRFRFIPVLMLTVLLTALCTAAVTQRHILSRKSDTYNSSAPARATVPAGTTVPTGAPSAGTVIPRLFVACGPDKEEIPSSSGGYELYTPDSEGNEGGIIACGAEPLSYLVEKVQDIPYVKLGTDITLEFRDGTVPDTITIQDLILRNDGSPKYTEQATEEFPLACSGGTAVFSLNTNGAAMLSSDMSSYMEAGILRGFRVNCQWADKSTAEYGFVIRTDASSTEIRNQAD